MTPWPENSFILTIEATKNRGWAPPSLEFEKWLGALPWSPPLEQFLPTPLLMSTLWSTSVQWNFSVFACSKTLKALQEKQITYSWRRIILYSGDIKIKTLRYCLCVENLSWRKEGMVNILWPLGSQSGSVSGFCGGKPRVIKVVTQSRTWPYM